MISFLDAWILGVLSTFAFRLLRLSLGLVFVWFGALKIFGVSPVEGLVAETVVWIPVTWLVPALGLIEVAIGTGLITGRLLRITMVLFTFQMLGTFLVLVVQPEVAFQQGNILALTAEGEFVVKNTVLLSAGLVIASRIRPLSDPKKGSEPSSPLSSSD